MKTGMRTRDELIELLSGTARRLLQSESPQIIVESVCHDVLSFLGCNTFFNFLVDDETKRLHLNSCAGIPEEKKADIQWLDYGVAICGCVARDGCRIVAENIQEVSDARTDLVKSLGVRAYACHPLLVQGRVIGTLSFGTNSRDNFSDEELSLMQAVADQVAIAMDRARTTAEIERLASFPQLNPSPVLELDMTGRITYSNRAAQELVESIGAGDAHILVPSDLDEILESCKTGKEKHWIRELEISYLSYQVNIFYAEKFKALRLYIYDITALKLMQESLLRTNEELENRVRERTADLEKTIGIIQLESSERLKAEIELKKSNERYMLAVLGANDGIWDWDFISGAAFVSSRWKSMLGYGEDEIQDVVNEWKNLIHPDDYQRAMETLDDYMSGRISEYRMEYRLRHKDGGYRWILTRGACFRDETGKPYRMAGSHTDITGRKAEEERRREAEAALRNETLERLRAVEELRAHERIMMQQGRHAAMGEMIGNIAHQWRQPLNTLGLIVQHLKYSYEAGDFSQEFLNTNIGKAMELIKHMSRTIDDFREFFKPDKDKRPFNINQAVMHSIALIEASFKSQFLSLEIDFMNDPVIYGYPGEFSQAILNILANARDVLLERNIANGQVRVSSWQEKDKTVIAISDNGGGIPEEIIEKIFDPYFTTKGPDKGTGIGLYMAKTIIEQNMGGRLTASNVQGGATFRIEVQHDSN